MKVREVTVQMVVRVPAELTILDVARIVKRTLSAGKEDAIFAPTDFEDPDLPIIRNTEFSSVVVTWAGGELEIKEESSS